MWLLQTKFKYSFSSLVFQKKGFPHLPLELVKVENNFPINNLFSVHYVISCISETKTYQPDIQTFFFLNMESSLLKIV